MSSLNESWDEYLERERKPSGRNPTVFLVLFALGYALMEWLYFLVPDTFLRDVIHHYGILQPCADILNIFAPHEGVTVDHGQLVSPHARLNIVRGCDGSGVSFLLVSAILAYPTVWRRKLFGLLSALVLIYVLNLARVIGLYFVIAYNKAWFLMAHTYLLPTLLILLCLLFFSYWAAHASSMNAPRTPT